MIYTVTFNPAIDYVMDIERLDLGMTNRSAYEQILPGGKGLNVSMVLNNLEIENTALGFIAGFTGEEIERRFTEMGGSGDFIKLGTGMSRINVKIRAAEETEINASGPNIDKESLSKLMEKLDLLKSGDILVLAGSIPASLPDSLYSDIMEMLSERGVMIAVDAEKGLLLKVLPCKPFLVKPNNHELGTLFGVTLTTRREVIPYAKKLQKLGARNVLVSMAGEGAVLAAENGIVFECEAPKGNVINSVGAGDSMVAGFIAGWCETKDYMHALKMGVSAGSASAFSEMLAKKEEVYNLLKLL